jgi:hypothetical protein
MKQQITGAGQPKQKAPKPPIKSGKQKRKKGNASNE